ncbi:MAG: glycosyltransferase [Pseudobutyrivibrio sp.]|nr:glycosyltransferase [Pseudobutyrivibrio sp.]
MVSIIVPVYNVERYVGDCIESLLTQTYNDIEIILVNNNSTDKSRDICDYYAQSNNNIILVDELKQGLGCARDCGVKFAKGDWIVFVDADDLITNNCIEILVGCAKEYDTDIVVSSFTYTLNKENDKEEEVTVSLNTINDYFFKAFIEDDEIISPFKCTGNLYAKHLIEKTEFGDIKFAEDSWFTPRVTYAGKENKILWVEKPRLYCYRQREDSLRHNSKGWKLYDRILAKQKTMDYWKENGEIDLYNIFFNDYYTCLLLDYLDIVFYDDQAEKKLIQQKIIIEKLLPEAKKHCNGEIILRPGAAEIWDLLCNSSKIIQYGFGNIGQNINKWLKRLEVDIYSVWDINGRSLGLDIVQPHKLQDEDVTFLIAVQDKKVARQVEKDLRNYCPTCKTVSYIQLETALKYGKFERFLPFIVEDYLRGI